jgi:hypothetical protein
VHRFGRSIDYKITGRQSVPSFSSDVIVFRAIFNIIL